jgi:perosamine synthetase
MNSKNKISKIKINYINLFNIFSLKNLKYERVALVKLKRLLNVKKNIIFLGRARTGIYLLIKYYLKNNKSKNNVVLTSAYTIPDIINLIKKGGGEPVFVDFDYKSTFFSIKDLKNKILKHKPKILLITHYHLEDKNLKKIIHICKKNKIIVLEDRAVSYGSIKKINIVSDGSIFSFSSFKLLNFYFGGALICKNNKIFEKIQSEVLGWKKMSLFQYLKQIFLTLSFQFITSKLIFNYFGFYLMNLNINKNKQNLNKIYFSKGEFNNSYFTRPSSGFYKEIYKKFNNVRFNQQHRVSIFSIYNKYLSKLSIPRNISKKDIFRGSCYNYLIYNKKAKLIRKKLFKSNFDTGRMLYENLSKSIKYKNKKNKTINLNDLSENLLVLPTHSSVSKIYAISLAKKILEIDKSI